MAKEIIIDNFLKMSPQIPQASKDNMNYLISGVDPLYYLSANSQEEQIAPLIASSKFTTLQTLIAHYTEIVDGAGYVGSAGATYDIIAVDDALNVYGQNISSAGSFGVADAGTYTGNNSGRAKVFASRIVFTSSVMGNIWTYDTSWHSTSFTFSNSTIHYMDTFLDNCIISDKSKVLKFASDFTTVTTAFDLGSNWVIGGIKNYNNKYVAIVASLGGNSISTNYLFLWDGISSRFNYSVKIPGQFIDMFVDENGVMTVSVMERYNQTALYYLSGLSLRRKTTIGIDIMSQSNSVSGNSFFFLAGLLGLRLPNFGLMLTGNTEVGEVRCILDSTSYTKVLLAGTGGNGGNLYAISGHNLLVYTDTTHFNNINYTSQWIPVKNLSAIDIYTDSLPVSGTDAINTTIYGDGEDIITGTSTTVLASITTTNSLFVKRTRLDVKNFTGNQVKVQISTTNSTWRPIIRKISLIQQ